MAKRSFRIVWTKVAEDDFGAIVDYVSQDGVEAAMAVFATIRAAAESLSRLPNRGRVVPELLRHGIGQYRERQVPPWRLVYRVEDGAVVVLALLDSRRDLDDLLLERLSRD